MNKMNCIIDARTLAEGEAYLKAALDSRGLGYDSAHFESWLRLNSLGLIASARKALELEESTKTKVEYNHWIKTTDQLPQKNELVLGNDGGEVFLVTFYGEHWLYSGYESKLAPIFWCKIPERK